MITQKLINLANAMKEYEGWLPAPRAGSRTGRPSISYQNHNPGNLRWSIFQLGKRKGFAYFYNEATGFFAMQYDLMKKCQGKTRLNLPKTAPLTRLITVYACVKDKALANYVNFICSRIGCKPDTPIGSFVK